MSDRHAFSPIIDALRECNEQDTIPAKLVAFDKQMPCDWCNEPHTPNPEYSFSLMSGEKHFCCHDHMERYYGWASDRTPPDRD